MVKQTYTMEDYDLYEKENLCKIIVGHLAIEDKIDTMLRTQFKKDKFLKKANLRFSQKVDLLLAFDMINEKLGEFIRKLNSYRNKFAHQFEYEISFDEAFDLVNQANSAGIDFSDDDIWRNKAYSQKVYGTEWIILEIVQNTNLALGFILEEIGFEVMW